MILNRKLGFGEAMADCTQKKKEKASFTQSNPKKERKLRFWHGSHATKEEEWRRQAVESYREPLLTG